MQKHRHSNTYRKMQAVIRRHINLKRSVVKKFIFSYKEVEPGYCQEQLYRVHTTRPEYYILYQNIKFLLFQEEYSNNIIYTVIWMLTGNNNVCIVHIIDISV